MSDALRDPARDETGHTPDDVRKRTMEFHYPENVTILGEYWLPSPNPIVIIVTESMDVGRTFEALGPWYAYFDLTIVPVTTTGQEMDVLTHRVDLSCSLYTLPSLCLPLCT